MLIPCYEHIIHRFAAPRNTPPRSISADGRGLRVASRHTLSTHARLITSGRGIGDETLTNFRESPVCELRGIPIPRTLVHKGKRMGHRTKLRPVLGRAASVAGATLERLKARLQVRWRNCSIVDQVAELVGIGIQVVILLEAIPILDVLPAVVRANA